MMQALVDFLAAYQPLYRQVAKGYPESDIIRLESALGRPVPPVFRDFLSTAAANIGFPLFDLTFDIDELIELALAKQPMLESFSNTLTPVATDLCPSYADYYMHTGRPAGDGDGEIVRSGAGSAGFDDMRVCPSLRDMLFTWGFQGIRMLPLEFRARVSWELPDFADPATAPTLQGLHLLLAQCGLQLLGVTSATNPLYDRGDCAASVYKVFLGQTFSVYVAGDKPQTVEAIVETLCDNMPGHGKRRPV